jgi:hypothetical protein
MGQGKFNNAVLAYSCKEVVTKLGDLGTVGCGICYRKRKRTGFPKAEVPTRKSSARIGVKYDDPISFLALCCKMDLISPKL